MSLLNDMLRDLSHQQTSVETAAVANQATLDLNAQEQRELFYNTSAAKPLPRTLVPSLLVFISVLAILVLWKLDFFAGSSTDIATTSPVVDQEIIQPAVIKQAVNDASVVAQATPSTEQLAAQPETVESGSVAPELGDRIAALESAITNLSVVVANANIQSHNKFFDTEAVVDDEAVSATLAQDNEPMLETGQGLEKAAIETSASESVREPFAQATTEASAEPQTMSLAEVGEPQLSIAPNSKWKDQQQAQQANELVAQGQADIAIEKLQNFIVSANQPRESVKALLEIFAGQENTVAMQALIAQANYLSVVEQTFYAAKIATIQQQDEQAIQLLETHLGEAERDENYRALLAGLYHRTSMHLEAATHYRRLLNVFGDKPAYWLGFALAQDALNQPQVAVQAYQRVNQYADLQPQVRTYVQQRIAALQH